MLWQRKYRLVLGNIEITELDISFEVVKSSKKEPNTASIRVHNLNPDHRRALEQADLQIELHAGYESGMALIFSGDILGASSRRERGTGHRRWKTSPARSGRITSSIEGPGTVTEIEAADSGRVYRNATIQKAWREGTSTLEMLYAALDALGVGRGNASEMPATVPAGPQITSGPARRVVDKLVRATGCTWAIRDGVFELRRAGRTVLGEALVLTGETGQISGLKRDADGTSTVISLIIPQVHPGRVVLVGTGQYLVKRCRYVGDMAGNDWYVEMTLEDY